MSFSDKKDKQKKLMVRTSLPLLFLRALFITLIIFSGYKILTSQQWLYPDDIFRNTKNKNFIIMGTYITSKDKVLEVMKKINLPKKPLYTIDVKKIEEKILEIETVKKVFVRRYWFPPRLRIVIEDKTPILMISPSENANPIAFFVEDGTLLNGDLLPKNAKIYPLNVITTGSNRNDNFVNWKQDRINALVTLADNVKMYTGENVKYIDIRDPNDIYIKIKTVLIRLGKLDEDYISRLNTISAIINNLDKIEEEIEYIDLRWDVTKYIKIKGKKDENGNNTIESENG